MPVKVLNAGKGRVCAGRPEVITSVIDWALTSSIWCPSRIHSSILLSFELR